MKIKSLLLFLLIGLSSTMPSFGAYETYEARANKAFYAKVCGTAVFAAAMMYMVPLRLKHDDLKAIKNRTPEQEAQLAELGKKLSKRRLFEYGVCALAALVIGYGVARDMQLEDSVEVRREAVVKRLWAEYLGAAQEACSDLSNFDDRLAVACTPPVPHADGTLPVRLPTVGAVIRPHMTFFTEWCNTFAQQLPLDNQSAAGKEVLQMLSVKDRSPKVQAICTQEAKIYRSLRSRMGSLHAMLKGKRALATIPGGLQFPPRGGDSERDIIAELIEHPFMVPITREMVRIERRAAAVESRYQVVAGKPVDSPIERTPADWVHQAMAGERDEATPAAE